MAEPCFSQIDVAMGGVDWKANVQIEDDDVRHCTLSTKKQRARRVDVSLTVFILDIVVLEVLLVLVTMAVLIGGVDWKANVQIEGRHETLHPADEIRTSTNNRCFTHSIHFGRCRAGGAACAGHDGCAPSQLRR